MSPWLTAGEVAELTGLVRWRAQCRALARMGVPFRPNAQGRPLVERALVLKAKDRERTPTRPKWEDAA